MKTIRTYLNISTCFIFILFTSNFYAQNFDWAKQMGGVEWDEANSICVDKQGYVYTTGQFAGTADFDPGTGVYSITAKGQPYFGDIYVKKLKPTGDLEWAKAMGGAKHDEGLSIAVDDSGYVYTTGTFKDTVDFDPGAGVHNLIATSTYNSYIQKLSPAGDLVWVKHLRGASPFFTSNLNTCSSNAIAIDAAGQIYAAGTFNGVVDFNPGIGTYTLNANNDTPVSGKPSVFVLKLTANGDFLWAKHTTSPNSTYTTIKATALALDASGNVYTTGEFADTVDFDPGTGVHQLVSTGYDHNAFILKLNSNGDFVWAKELETVAVSPGLYSSTGNAIAIDNSGALYITGEFKGTVDFDPGSNSHNLSSKGSVDAFVLKLTSTGNFVWAKQNGGTGSEEGVSIALDSSNNIYITGSFAFDSVDFDPGINTNYLRPKGPSDLYIQKLNSNGNFIWARSMGGEFSHTHANSIAVDVSENVYVAGRFEGRTDFDPNSGTFDLVSAGTSDPSIFVVKLNSITAGVKDNVNSNSIAMYPNPCSNGNFTINISDSEIKTLEIYTSTGQLLYTQQVTKGVQQVSANIESSGVYFVNLFGNQSAYTEKLIVY